MRVKAIISYNGSKFFGFQKQSSTNQTITCQIQKALNTINIDSKITGSGRTDAGVHATGQVIHFDLPLYWRDLYKLKSTLNRSMSHIAIKHISRVSSDFHARFHAKKRLYRYIFKTTKPTIFERDFVSHYQLQNPNNLNSILQEFVGEHDFGSFSKNGSKTHSDIRRIYRAYHIERKGYHLIYFEANGFLRSQVRMMIDFTLKVSNDELTTKQLREQLNNQALYNRNLSDPAGLYLARVIY